MARNEPWSDTENAVTVRAYLNMLEQELTGQHYSKTQYRREVAERIGRSEASLEWKFRNVSAVLADQRCVYVRGYKPAVNYQDSLADEVTRQVRGRPDFFHKMDTAVDRDAADLLDLNWTDSVMPTEVLITDGPHRLHTRGYHTDYVAREAANKSLGDRGERAVVRRERSILEAAGRRDLAEQVRHVSLEDGDGWGYDVKSFEPNGEERHLEVKTTRQSINWPMIVSRHEVRVSESKPEHYVLMRLYNFGDGTGYYELHGAISATCDLDPLDYLALPKASAA